jgi:hypothetical protein
VGFEPKIPVFEWAKIVHALDRAATVIGRLHTTWTNMLEMAENQSNKASAILVFEVKMLRFIKLTFD